MNQIKFQPDGPNQLSQALAAAAEVAKRLTDAGIEIHNAFDNGRRMVLVIDKAPQFVSGCPKRHHPNGVGGTTTVHAASYHGCQLEWLTETAGVREVANGC